MIVHQPDRILLRKYIGTHRLSGTVLDVGGGDGKRYRNFYDKTVSLDTCPDADIVADAENMPVEDNTCDSVLCSQMLEHVPHPQRALEEIYRVLKPNGTALLTVPQLNEIHEEPHDYYRFTNFGLQKMFGEIGFVVVDMHQRGKYHSLMCQNRLRYWIDRLDPYKKKRWMYVLSPISAIYSNVALFRDKLDQTESCQRHALGWDCIIRKPS